MRLRNHKDVVDIEVPQSLLAFVRAWSKDGKHKIDNTVLSLFSHGLLSLVALSDYDCDLVEAVSPILADLCDAAPKNAHVLQVVLRRDGTVSVHD